MPPASTDEIIRRLYEAPPETFVAARTAAIAAARQAGDRAAVARLTAQRKPTVAAWLVNLLALRRPDLVDELVELSAALRAAQRDLHGEQLRELTNQRRQVVSALVRTARALAVAQDPAAAAGKLPLAEVEATLSAALAEEDIAAQVRTGRLIRAVSYAGFGEVPRPRLRLVTDESEGVRRELIAARTDADRAADELTAAQTAERDAEQEIAELDAALTELEQRRAEAQARLARQKSARQTAERQSAAARRRVGDVQAAIDEQNGPGIGPSQFPRTGREEQNHLP